MQRLGLVPTVSLLVLAGAGLGAHFGRATVASINPFYFTEPQGTQSYAALTPQGVRYGSDLPAIRASGSFDDDYGYGCGGCALRGGYEHPDDVAARAAYIEAASVEPEPEAEDYPVYEAETDTAALADERRLIQLYAHYPVNQEERAAHLRALDATLERPAAGPATQGAVVLEPKAASDELPW